MAKRSNRPPLYELFREREGPVRGDVPMEDRAKQPTRRERPPRQRERVVDDVGEPGDGLAGWFSGGKTLRVPVGYVLLVIAGVVLLQVVTYMVGYSVAKQQVEDEFAEQVLADREKDQIGRAIDDPLMNEPGPNGGARIDVSTDPRRFERGGTPAAPPPDAGNGQRPPVIDDVFTDPRVEGHEYYVLMTTNKEGAERLARFCREHGLDAYVVGDNNKRLRVIALPGFRPEDRQGPVARQVKQTINDIGLKWKLHNKGGHDLRDAYPSLYRND